MKTFSKWQIWINDHITRAILTNVIINVNKKTTQFTYLQLNNSLIKYFVKLHLADFFFRILKKFLIAEFLYIADISHLWYTLERRVQADCIIGGLNGVKELQESTVIWWIDTRSTIRRLGLQPGSCQTEKILWFKFFCSPILW